MHPMQLLPPRTVHRYHLFSPVHKSHRSMMPLYLQLPDLRLLFLFQLMLLLPLSHPALQFLLQYLLGFLSDCFRILSYLLCQLRLPSIMLLLFSSYYPHFRSFLLIFLSNMQSCKNDSRRYHCFLGGIYSYAQKINPIQIIDKGFVLLTRTTFLLVV